VRTVAQADDDCRKRQKQCYEADHHLCYEADHHLHVIHKSLSDWLNAEWLRRNFRKDERGGGHRLLGIHLLKCEVKTATDSGAAGGIEASAYALKYTVPHLVCSLCAGATQAKDLDIALRWWPFIRQAFRAGHGAKLVAALGRAEADGRLSDYGGEALRWTLQEAPINSTKYKEALEWRDKSSLAACKPKVLRTYLVLGRKDMKSWAAEKIVFKGHS
jgi:hypothetical protein